jgi:hypothetical protein
MGNPTANGLGLECETRAVAFRGRFQNLLTLSEVKFF